MNRKYFTPTTLLVTLLLTAGAGAQIIAPDVVDQIRNLRGKGDKLGSRLTPGFPVPQNNFHYQGFARHPDPRTGVVYATMAYPCSFGAGFTGGAVLAVIDISWADVNESWRLRSNRLSTLSVDSTAPRTVDKVVNVIRLPNSFHPSGIQTCGNFLIMGSYGQTDYGCAEGSFVKLYDISDPYNPVERTPPVNIGNAGGAAGITQLSDGRYVAVGDYSGTLTFKVSDDATASAWNTSYSFAGANLIDEDPDRVAVWPVSGGGTYEHQSLCLVLGEDHPGTPNRVESLYLLGLRNTSNIGAEVDRIAIYGVDLPPSGSVATIWQITERDFPNDPAGHFTAGSSVWVAPDGELMVYKCPLYNTGPLATLPFVEHSSYKGKNNGVAPAGDCLAHVQLYTATNLADDSATNYSIGVDAVDVLYEDYSFLGNVDPIAVMNESISSVAWTLPEGCFCRLYEHPNFNPVGGGYLDLVGTGTTQQISNLANVTWTNNNGNPNNKISSLGFSLNCPGRGYFTGPGPWNSNIYAPMTALMPTNVCTVLKMTAGNYPVSGLSTLDRAGTLHAVGGMVTIGNP